MSEQGTTKDQVSGVDELCVIGAGCGHHPMPTAVEAWRAKYALRIMAVCNCSEDFAIDSAKAVDDETIAKRMDDPEGAADEEMEYWTDDGDGHE